MTVSPEMLALTHAAAFQDRRPWSAEEFAQLIQSDAVILHGDARSFLLGRVILDEAEVLTVATHPDFQREGRARDHLQAFLVDAQSRSARTAFLEVAENNIPAKSLYLNTGFAEAGRRPRYYTDPSGAKIDAVLLRKSL